MAGDPKDSAGRAGRIPVAHPQRTFSLAGKLAATVVAGIACALLLVGLASLVPLALPTWLVLLVSFGLTAVPTLWAVHVATRPIERTVAALADGIRSFRDNDFSMRLVSGRDDELGELVELYNSVSRILQDERSQIRQRELLLQTALDESPIAIVLANPLGRVVYANLEARRLFLGGDRLEGWRFADVLAHCPAQLREVADSGNDGIFTVDQEDRTETYHLAQRGFYLNRFPHALYLLRRMTPELSRQEAQIWKKVIRIISHELNNSLAPISSLAHSGLQIARRPDALERLEPIYESIRERTDHLTRFLEGYARFARLPEPRKQHVDWSVWLAGPRKLFAFELVGPPPVQPGYFDPAQLEQVLINLLKNAAEAGASDDQPTEVRIDRLPDGGAFLQVLDRGRGMSREVMQQALLPFYSTKQDGSGVGLPLCREIVEAHGGALRIQNREGGGTVVSLRLPPAPGAIPRPSDELAQ